MSKINLTPITAADVGDRKAPTLKLDRFKRLILNAAARDLLAVSGVKTTLYMSVDPAQKYVALYKSDGVSMLPNALALTITARGYISASWLFDKFGLKVGNYTFEYRGVIDAQGVRWQGFRLIQR